MSFYRLSGILLAVTMTGCGVELAGADDELSRGASSNELAFARDVKVGDIILTSDNPKRGCWYLNKAENWYTNPRYCHAALVVEKTGETGITTIEALNTSQNIKVLSDREQDLVSDLETKLAVLRVTDPQGEELPAETIQTVVEQALAWS